MKEKVRQSDRGDEFFMSLLESNCNHVLDLKALDILPGIENLRAANADPKNELPHPRGNDTLWNESWYFDVADVGMGIGAWMLLGLTPHQTGSWYTAMICGPDRPTVAIVDF